MFLKIGQAKMFLLHITLQHIHYILLHIRLVSEYIPFVSKKRYLKHADTNKKAKETNEEKRHTE